MADVAVTVGRFQVDSLTEGHRLFLKNFLNIFSDLYCIFIGVKQDSARTNHDPLTYMERWNLIREYIYKEFPDIAPRVSIEPILDQPSDELWSKILDERIEQKYLDLDIILIGGRESFLSRYTGRYRKHEIPSLSSTTATDRRRDIKKLNIENKDQRFGAIHTIVTSYPKIYATVDVAIYNEDKTKILLGRKKNQNKLRLVGGFVDIRDGCLEQTARRESLEETGNEIGDIKYIGSFKIDDWRYQKDNDVSIMTSLFVAKKVFGPDKPNDDIEELEWFSIKEDNITIEHTIVPEHWELIKAAFGFLTK